MENIFPFLRESVKRGAFQSARILRAGGKKYPDYGNGALGTLHSSRWATGHANTVALRIYGDQGALDINLDRPAPEALRICAGKDVDTDTWRAVKCAPVPTIYRRFVDAIRKEWTAVSARF